MKAEEIRDRLQAIVGPVELTAGGAGDAFITVPEEKWVDAARALRDTPELRFDFLRSLCGVDRLQAGKIEVVIHLFSYGHKHSIVVKTAVPRKDGSVATLSGIWPAAEWHERELYDLFGVHVRGHRDLRRILNPDDWEGHPLLKDYQEPEHYQGIPMRRPAPEARGGKPS